MILGLSLTEFKAETSAYVIFNVTSILGPTETCSCPILVQTLFKLTEVDIATDRVKDCIVQF
jgi:hypothetical protein